MRWPVGVRILIFQPWKNVAEFFCGSRKRETISNWDFGVQDVAVLRKSRHDSEQIEGGATDHYGVKLKTSLSQMLIE
jgi:hypothetical protein